MSITGPLQLKIRNNTVFIVLSPELGLAELLLRSFQTGQTHLQSLMSLSKKVTLRLAILRSKPESGRIFDGRIDRARSGASE